MRAEDYSDINLWVSPYNCIILFYNEKTKTFLKNKKPENPVL